MERLAIEGGPAVRSRPLEPSIPSSTFLGEEERNAVLEVLESKSLFRYQGPHLLGKVASFERDFAARAGARHAVAVCSGTAALHTALMALGITCGDEVLIPAFYYVATANAILATGAVPVFVEVDQSLTMDLADLEAKITDRTAAIIPVHMRGVPAKMDKIMEIAEKHNLLVVEDCAQSAGVTYGGKFIGTFGNAGTFSLQYYKVLSTGDGGVLIMDDDELYEKAVRFQNNGNFPGRDPRQAIIGLNLRMPELIGAVACEQLKKLDGIVHKTRERKTRLKELLRKACSSFADIEFRHLHDPAGEIGISLVIFVPEEKGQDFSRALEAEGIPNWWLYDSAGHSYHTSYALLSKRTLNDKQYPFSLPCNRPIQYYPGMCPQTDRLLRRAIHFDISPFYSDGDLEAIAAAVEKVAYWLFR